MVLLLTCVLVSYPKFSGKGYIFSRRDVCVFTWLFAICSSVVCDELHTHTHTHRDTHDSPTAHKQEDLLFHRVFISEKTSSWRSKEFLLTETVLLVKIFVLTHTYTHTWWRLSLLKN